MDIKIPSVGESITKVLLSKWLVADNDIVQEDQIIAEIETDKITIDLKAEISGQISILSEQSTEYNVGDIIAKITHTVNKKIEASPLAKKILEDKGIPESDIIGTGPNGKITRSDAENAIPKTIDQRKDRQESRSKISVFRKTLSDRLLSAKNETAMLTTFQEFDMLALTEIRKKYKDKFHEKYGSNLSFMSFFIKAIALSLEEFKELNARIEADEIVYSNFVDCSIAVATQKGVVTPVIRDVDKMHIYEIEKNIRELSDKAKNNKLGISDLIGGTFTITNGGVFGSLFSTPLLNSPQSGILGMHNIIDRPVVVDNNIVIRPMMYVALSYDHRMIDGKDAVGFLLKVKQFIEDPTRLLIEI